MNQHIRDAAWLAVLVVAAAGCNSSGSSDQSGSSEMDDVARMLDQQTAAAPEQPKPAEPRERRRTKPARVADVAGLQPLEEPQAVEARSHQPSEQVKAEVAAQNKVGVAARTPRPQVQPDRPRASEVVTTPGQPQVVGKRRYRNTVEGPMRYYGAVASARMVMKDQILYAQIRKSLDLFEATNSRYPKDTDEFMERVINENMIELPELRPNQEYFYDPTDHELKIGELLEQPSSGESPPQQ